MDITLALTWPELAQKVALARHPLEIFHLVNLYEPCDWKFTISFDSSNRIHLTANPSANLDPRPAMSGLIVQLFDSDLVTINDGNGALSFEPRATLQKGPTTNSLSTLTGPKANDWLEVTGFGRGTLPAVFLDNQALSGYLYEHTWLGSSKLLTGTYSIQIQVLDHRLELENKSAAVEHCKAANVRKTPCFSCRISVGSPPIGEVFFWTSADVRAHHLRWAQSGFLSVTTLDILFSRSVIKRMPNGYYELAYSNYTPTPDGLLVLSDETQADLVLFGETLRAIRGRADYAAYIAQCDHHARTRSAERLDKRKAKLAHSEFVFVGNEPVYVKPTCEMDAVALHHKLEGMNALPFHTFKSLEYTPKLDIDSLAHFKVDKTEPLTHFATVEYEFRLKNFFSHAHPPEQTDLIICWEIGDQAGYKLSPVPGKPWLYSLTVGTALILVAEISKYPAISISTL
jgi:hypothetical protein